MIPKKQMIKEIAKKLDGLEYRFNEEKLGDLFKQAKDNNILIVFGASDDLCELRGAFYDELDAWDGRDYTQPYSYFDDHKDMGDILGLIELKALWCGRIFRDDESVKYDSQKNHDVSFSYEVSDGVLFEEFNIMEDGEVYCVGIVIDLDSVKADYVKNNR